MSPHVHRRYNPLKNEWVLVSPQRTQRPWLGSQEMPSQDLRPAYDPHCYLCPGNTRANGKINPQYTDTFVFINDFAALIPPEHIHTDNNHNTLFQTESVSGECRVICFSKQHNLTLADMNEPDINKVIALWSSQIQELGQQYHWVQIFENKGESMGCSNVHPHGQIWASNFLPHTAHQEMLNQTAYYQQHGLPLLLAYAKQECLKQERIVCENKDWLVVVPYWATWPFETLLLPKVTVTRMPNLSLIQQQSLAQILKVLLVKYDRLFNVPFPYSMGWHGAPETADPHYHWQLHAHFYPPLLRSASIKKFMVGYEMLAEAQRDFTAEYAAQCLRNLG